MKQYQKILVTGASGQLGRKLVRKLIYEGYAVRAQYRSEFQAKRWNPEGVEIVLGDLLDDGWYDKAVAGCGAVIHCAAWVSMRQVDADLMHKVNVEGTRKIAEACRKSDSVRRLVHISSVAAVGGSRDGLPLKESFKFNLLKYNVPYFTTKYYAERKAFEYNDEHLEVIAVNPSIMISPPDRQITEEDLAKIPKRLPVYFDFGLNLVNAYDVVDGIIAALEKGRPGNRYILGGEDIDQDRALELAGDYLGMKRPSLKIPYPVFPIIGAAFDIYYNIKRLFVRHVRAPVFGLNFARLAKYHFYFDSSKAKDDLDYSPRSIAETIDEILAGSPGPINTLQNHSGIKKELQP